MIAPITRTKQPSPLADERLFCSDADPTASSSPPLSASQRPPAPPPSAAVQPRISAASLPLLPATVARPPPHPSLSGALSLLVFPAARCPHFPDAASEVRGLRLGGDGWRALEAGGARRACSVRARLLPRRDPQVASSLARYVGSTQFTSSLRNCRSFHGLTAASWL